MDVKEIFEDSPYTRGELFYTIYKQLQEKSEDEILELYEDTLSKLTEDEVKDIKQNEFELASLFTALADQYEQEEEYKKAVLEPAYKEFNKYEQSIHISGFD